MRSTHWLVVVAAVAGGSSAVFACGGSTSSSSQTTDSGAGDGSTADVTTNPDTGSPMVDSSTPDSSQTVDTGTMPMVDSGAPVDSAVEAEAGPWTPVALGSKVAMWLAPSSLQETDGGVTKWADLSGNGNDAVQNNATYQPTFTMAGLNGLPAATFNGPATFLSIADTTANRWGTGDFAMYAVIKGAATTTANFAMLYQKTAGSAYDGINLYVNSAKPAVSTLAAIQISGAVYLDNKAPPATFIDGTPHILGGRRYGQTLEIRVDGASSNIMTNDAGLLNVDVSAMGSPAAIGQNGNGGAEFQQYHGDISELIAVVGTITDGDVANLEAYFKTKYGL